MTSGEQTQASRTWRSDLLKGDFNKPCGLMLRSNVRIDRNAYVVELRVMVDFSSGKVDLRAVDTDSIRSRAGMSCSVRDWKCLAETFETKCTPSETLRLQPREDLLTL